MDKDKVINALLKKVADLEWKVERLEEIIGAIEHYVDMMSFAPVVDNPKEDLYALLSSNEEKAKTRK